MACTYADFILRYPEFAILPEARVQMFLDDAACDVDETKFKDCVGSRITCALAAHYSALAYQSANGNAGSVGQMLSKTVDKVSATYATPDANLSKGSNGYYMSTIYGQEYLSLLRRYCPGILTI